jgi:transposase
MEEYQKTGNLSKAAMRADMDRKTAGKYLKSGKLPAQMNVPHTWRTRPDPFAQHWGEVEPLLKQSPELEAKVLFEWLCEQYPESYQEGQLRTFQRKVSKWRALEGPDQEIFFPQKHQPGVKMQTDFTWMNELGVTIAGERFDHLLCHNVLTYSNWEWASICQSESLLALRRGLQAALARLGRLPKEHWTDHSTAATHSIRESGKGARKFNPSYLALMAHYELEPRTIQVGKPNENGDVESAHGVLKRRVKQHLLLRGHRDFGCLEEYQAFLEKLFERANRLRQKRLAEELGVMRELSMKMLPEYAVESSRVSSWSTVQLDRNTYSVPSRLKGRKVQARIFADHIEVYCHRVFQLSTARLRGECHHAINYRHVIGWLLRKPGAFRQYRYRADLFPSEVFYWAYEALEQGCSPRTADLEYLRVLHHAAQTMETQVEQALLEVKARGILPRYQAVLEFAPCPRPEPPDLPPLEANLAEYDSLLSLKEAR